MTKEKLLSFAFTGFCSGFRLTISTNIHARTKTLLSMDGYAQTSRRLVSGS